MKEEIDVRWKGQLQFSVPSIDPPLFIDIPIEKGGTGNGISPKKLLLISLAGCTGMDVITILRNHEKLPESLRIEITGMEQEDSGEYQSIHIIYVIETKDAYKEITTQAVNSSLNRYCSIGQMLRKAVSITYEVNFAG